MVQKVQFNVFSFLQSVKMKFTFIKNLQKLKMRKSNFVNFIKFCQFYQILSIFVKIDKT